MPQIGDIATNGRSQKKQWCACIDCGKERWVWLVKGAPGCDRCRDCVRKTREWKVKISKANGGANHYAWKGGKTRTGPGYIMVTMGAENPYFGMASNRRTEFKGRVLEHRLVMAKHLARCLHSFEIVHHKNGIKGDNRIENLELSMNGAHTLMHNKGYRDGFQKGLNDGRTKHIQKLKDRIAELETKIKEEE